MWDIVTDVLNEMIKDHYRKRFDIRPYGMLWDLYDMNWALICGTKDLILRYLREGGFLLDWM